MKAAALFAGLSLLTMSSPGIAQVDPTAPLNSANNFQRLCQSDASLTTYCMTYVLGTYHALRETSRASGVCLPKGVDTGQLFEVGLQYIRQHPELGHYAPAPLLIASWEQAFPCPNGQTP